MEARPASLNELLASAKRFIIPEYQRAYVWTKEEVEQLWDDLWDDYQESCGADVETARTDGYFLGPIVVASQDELGTGAKLAYVVDGQQRLTTLSALLWLIHNKLQGSVEEASRERAGEVAYVLNAPGGKTNRLKVAGRDAGNFSAIIGGGVLDETSCLGVAARYLRTEVDERSEKDVAEFATFLLNRTRFVFVQTGSFSSAWELFIGLNGKGRPLSPADLIKAYVCGMSPDSEAFAGIWEKSVLPLENDATGAILDTVRMATGEVGSDAALFKMVESALPAKKIDAEMLRVGAEAYHRFWLKPIDRLKEEDGVDTVGLRALRSLRVLRRRDVSPVLIALARQHGFAAMFDSSLLQLLDSLQLSMAICGKRGKERPFTALASRIRQENLGLADGIGEIRKAIMELAPPGEVIRDAIRHSAYKGRVMLHVVKSYEEGMRGDVRIEDVWYEHIMPQTPTPFWYDAAGTTDPNRYARIANNIGNITPLDPATNIKGSNAAWSTKRELFMKEVPNWLAAEIARNNPDRWAPQQIADRATAISQWAVETRWPLQALLRT